jgi:hypothetical protein
MGPARAGCALKPGFQLISSVSSFFWYFNPIILHGVTRGRADVFLDGQKAGEIDAYLVDGSHNDALWPTYGLKPGPHDSAVSEAVFKTTHHY